MSGWPSAHQASGIAAQQSPPAGYAYPPSMCISDLYDLHHGHKLTQNIDPAFIPVQTRSGFGQYPQPYVGVVPPPIPPPQAAPAPVDNSPAKSKTEWPPSVRSYVQRSFLPHNDDPSVTRAEVEAKLKQTIGTAKEDGSMYTIDWDKMPLPQSLVKAEREANLRNGLYTIDNPRKRKSAEFDEPATSQPPWQSTNSRSSLESRITYSSAADDRKSSKLQKDMNKRKRRFETEYKAANVAPSSPPPESGPVIGTNETLEKRYLRLTAPPVPANVRPERVLNKTLDLLKKKWRKEGNYSYICDQFKSMRQDLTVQHIKNDFTVSVYEIHARIALEKGDIGEYNQCQTQLRSLYAKGLKGNPVEFKAYRILYFIHTANRSGLNDTLADLTSAEKEERPIKHALNVRSALALGNYHRFFQLYLDTPNMGAYLMDMFVVRERLAALCNICKAYVPYPTVLLFHY